MKTSTRTCEEARESEGSLAAGRSRAVLGAARRGRREERGGLLGDVSEVADGEALAGGARSPAVPGAPALP